MRLFTSLIFAASLGLALGCMKKEESQPPAPKVEPEPIITPTPVLDPNKKLDPDPSVGPVIGPNGVPMPRIKNPTTNAEVTPLPDPSKNPIIKPMTPVETKPKPILVDPKPPTSDLEVAPPPREKKK